MKRVFIAAEFNPFHNAHAYIISQAKKLSGGAPVVCAMGGSFVQRGGPAIFDKRIRAAVAAYCGADLTVQLPFVYAAQNAETFAFGAVKTALLSGCGAMCFGVETDSYDKLIRAAELCDSAELKDMLKDHPSSAVPYPQARIEALKRITGEDFSFLVFPNNILALEYLRAINRLEAKLTPVFVKRLKNGDTQPASEIRAILLGGEKNNARIKVPFEAYRETAGEREGIFALKTNNIEAYAPFFKAALITKTAEEIALTADIGEGSVSRLIKNAQLLDGGTEAFVASCTAKRLSAARIRRSLINLIMDYKKEDARFYSGVSLNYIRVLSVGERGGEVIKALKAENEELCVITRLAKELDRLGNADARALRLDIKADNLYGVFSGEPYSDLKYTPYVIRRA